MDLLKYKSNKEMAYDMLTLLKEMEEMSYYNLGCYSQNVVMTKPKEEYKKQYATELYRIELLQQLKVDISKKYDVNMLLCENELKLTNEQINIILK